MKSHGWTMKSDQIINNVQQLIHKFGDRIKDDKSLLLAYWSTCDKIKMDRIHMLLSDWKLKATDASMILEAREIIKLMDESQLKNNYTKQN